MQSTFQITLSIGVSERVRDLDELSFSHRSAQDALNRRFLTGDGSIHFADELSLPSPAAEHYPYETGFCRNRSSKKYRILTHSQMH